MNALVRLVSLLLSEADHTRVMGVLVALVALGLVAHLVLGDVAPMLH